MTDTPRPGGDFDLRHHWMVFWKRRWLILALTAVVVGGVFGWTLQQPRIYQATATVIIDPQAPKFLGQAGNDVVELGNGSFWDSTEYYNTQQRILRSLALAEEVVRANDLHKDPRLVGSVQLDEDEAVARAARYVQGGIRVTAVKDSRVFGVGFRDEDPKLAAELANHIVATYIQQNLGVKHEVTARAKRWIAEQLDDARRDLDTSETALYQYKKSNNILSIDLKEQRNLISRALDQFSLALTETKRKRIDLMARRKAVAGFVTAEGMQMPSTHIVQSETVGRLREAYLDERRKLVEMEGVFGDRHPALQAQQARVNAALDAVRIEATTILKAIDAEIGALAEAEGRYQGEIDRLTADALDLNQKEIEYRRLDRQTTNAAEVYGFLIKRLNESGLQELDQGNNIRALDRALVPSRPVEPRVRQMLALGLMAGLALALALAYLAEMMDRTVKRQEDVEVTTGYTFLGMVPAVKDAAGARELHIVKHPNSSAAECCRVLRTNILFCSPDRPLRKLLVTSSNPVEGKTMSVVNLGVVMAQGGNRTLLVDTDMRRPRLHKVLGVPNDHGVSRLVMGEGEIEDAVKTTEVPNLYVLPCGPIPPNPAELLQTERFAKLAEKLAEKFDRVIFDSPPLLAVTDAAILAQVVEGAVLVARAGRTTRDALARSKNHLDAVKARVIGVVLNDVDLASPGYAYYYGYRNAYYTSPTAPASPTGEPETR